MGVGEEKNCAHWEGVEGSGPKGGGGGRWGRCGR